MSPYGMTLEIPRRGAVFKAQPFSVEPDKQIVTGGRFHEAEYVSDIMTTIWSDRLVDSWCRWRGYSTPTEAREVSKRIEQARVALDKTNGCLRNFCQGFEQFKTFEESRHSRRYPPFWLGSNGSPLIVYDPQEINRFALHQKPLTDTALICLFDDNPKTLREKLVALQGQQFRLGRFGLQQSLARHELTETILDNSPLPDALQGLSREAGKLIEGEWDHIHYQYVHPVEIWLNKTLLPMGTGIRSVESEVQGIVTGLNAMSRNIRYAAYLTGALVLVGAIYAAVQ